MECQHIEEELEFAKKAVIRFQVACQLVGRGRGWFLVSRFMAGSGCISGWGPFTQDAEAHLRANFRANPLMLLASCVNTPIDCSVFHNLHVLQGAPGPV